MARVLVSGILAGVAIGLIANVIGIVFYNLSDDTVWGAFAGALTAAVIGAIFGAVAIYTATRTDAAVIFRGVAAGAFIGVVGGFLGGISPDAPEGIIANTWLISIFTGIIFGAAELRGTGMKFASPWVDEEDERLGTLGKALDGVFAGILVGVACALSFMLFYGGKILIQPRLDPRVDFVRLVSTDEILLGAMLGIVVGAVVGLILSRKRVEGLLNGALIGAIVGIILALPAITVMTFTELGGFWGGTPYFGTLAITTIGGLALGAAMPDNRFDRYYHRALVGAGIVVASVLPSITLWAIISFYDSQYGFWALLQDRFSRTYDDRFIDIIAAASVCLIVSTLIQRRIGASTNSIVIGSVVATAIAIQSSYFLFLLNVFLGRQAIELPSILFQDQFISALLRGILIVSFGTLTGLVIGAVMKFAETRLNPDRILPDSPTD